MMIDIAIKILTLVVDRNARSCKTVLRARSAGKEISKIELTVASSKFKIKMMRLTRQ